MSEVYSSIQCPALILYNSCDYITTRTCHEWIRDTMTAAGNPDVRLRIVDQADHRYARVSTASESFRTSCDSGVPLNPEPFVVISDWLAGKRD